LAALYGAGVVDNGLLKPLYPFQVPDDIVTVATTACYRTEKRRIHQQWLRQAGSMGGAFGTFVGQVTVTLFGSISTLACSAKAGQLSISAVETMGILRIAMILVLGVDWRSVPIVGQVVMPVKPNR
jgi:hypothetical protein